jgi:hypothetical protein
MTEGVWPERVSKEFREILAEEIPKLKASIDEGEPVVVGLIGARRATDVGKENHQVVCYGYEESSGGRTTLFIYDPNYLVEVELSRRINPQAGVEILGNVPQVRPHRDLTHTVRFGRAPVQSEPIRTVTGAIYPAFEATRGGPWRGFFVQNYSPSPNPPQHFGAIGGGGKYGGGVDRPPKHMR